MRNTFIITAFLFTLSHLCLAQNIYTQIDSIANSHAISNPEIGISIGFIKNNVEYYTAYGKLSKTSNTEINKNSVFEIASITKILTANLVAQAVLDGKLVLSDYIDNYLPQQYEMHENLQNKIRISDLASHQSGLPDIDFRSLIAKNPQQPIASVTADTLVELFNSCTQMNDYGKYRYSTFGYTLLGQILEKIYGKSYDQIFTERLITPLQLSNTLTKEFDVPNITKGYNLDGGEQEFFEWNVNAPAGLIKSTASDMVTYLKAILNDESQLSKAAMLTEQVYYSEGQRALGLGTNISIDGESTLYLKSGDSMGQSSIICYNRTTNWGVIIFLNHQNSKLRMSILNEIIEVVSK
jgi:CubicO group peptidase (beta-lactamase class C family)